jgi:flagellar protein FlgJ
MIDQTNLSGSLAIDARGLGELRQAANKNSPEALKGAAKQFEALFMNMVMKSMRDATPQDGLFDSQQSKMYTSMLDQQVSQKLASRGVGLAEVLIRQLSNNALNQAVQAPAATDDAMPAAASAEAPVVETMKPSTSKRPHIREFYDRLSADAAQASSVTGIPAKFMIAQAALESGWGKREILAADGTPSHNLFGIKASGNWTGKVVQRVTTEYVNGVPQTRMEKFRAYDSYAEGFRDYANLLRNNPRYQNVIANAQDVSGFANGLQRAGYATDPNYAAKLTRIIKQTMA